VKKRWGRTSLRAKMLLESGGKERGTKKKMEGKWRTSPCWGKVATASGGRSEVFKIWGEMGGRISTSGRVQGKGF